MSLVSQVSDSLFSYARFWGVDPSVVRSPSKREIGLVAMLAVTPLLSACPGSVDPPVGPRVSVVSPVSGREYASPLEVALEASSPVGIDSVRALLDGVEACSWDGDASLYECSVPVEAGSRSLEAVAVDTGGASVSRSVSFSVVGSSCEVNPAVAYWDGLGGDSPDVDVSALGSDCSLTATNVSYDGYESAGVSASWLSRLRRGYDAEFMDAVHSRLMGRGMSVEKAQEWFDGYGADGSISYDNWLVALRNIEEHEKAISRGWLDPELDQFLTPRNLPILTHWFIEDFALPRTNDDGSMKEGVRNVSYMDWSGPGGEWFGFPQLAGLAPEGEQRGQDFNGFDFSSYWPVVLDEHGGVVQAHHSFPFPSLVRRVIPLYFDWPDNYDHQVPLESVVGRDYSGDTLGVSGITWHATHGNGPAPDADGYFRPDGLPIAPGGFVMPSNASTSGSLGQLLFNVSTINVDPRDPRDPEGLVNYDVVVEAPSGEWPGAVDSFLRDGFDQIDVFYEYPGTDLNLMVIDYRVNRPVFEGSEFVGWDHSGHLPLGPTPR
jgi:hypothetical protein